MKDKNGENNAENPEFEKLGNNNQQQDPHINSVEVNPQNFGQNYRWGYVELTSKQFWTRFGLF